MADAGSSTSACYLARVACQSWLLSRVFIAPRPPGGLVVPSRGCRTLRRACKCGSRGGSGLRSARVPPYLESGRPFRLDLVLLFRFAEFHKQMTEDGRASPHPTSGASPEPRHPSQARTKHDINNRFWVGENVNHSFYSIVKEVKAVSQRNQDLRYHRRLSRPAIILPAVITRPRSMGYHLVLGCSLGVHQRRGLMLLLLAIKVKRLLDLLAEALAIRRLAVAAMLLLVDIACSTPL
jgi:hypothetical protein